MVCYKTGHRERGWEKEANLVSSLIVVKAGCVFGALIVSPRSVQQAARQECYANSKRDGMPGGLIQSPIVKYPPGNLAEAGGEELLQPRGKPAPATIRLDTRLGSYT
ncbi:hypothetical protein Bbelb_129300 [Branchiostoma belcheri]|nr:hypothetical protein Bbelb_129300 [Branchiostoma belcheri]